MSPFENYKSLDDISTISDISEVNLLRKILDDFKKELEKQTDDEKILNISDKFMKRMKLYLKY